MKKGTLLLSGILISSMAFGTVITPNTVHADGTAATQAEQTTTSVRYYLRGESSGTLGKPFAMKDVTGTIGTPITDVPNGYVIIKGANFSATEPNSIVEIAKKASATVNYIDPNGNILKTETINGGEGSYYSLTSDLPTGYYWDNDSESGITLVDGKEYNLPVSESITNKIIFKTADNTEVGQTTIRSNAVGDVIYLSNNQLPSGYSTDDNAVTLQDQDNTQVVTVYKNPSNVTAFNGVVTVNKNVYGAYLYDIKGNQVGNRVLGGGSAWKVSRKMTLNNKEYYQVSTNEWIPADLVTVTSQGSVNNSIDGNNTVKASDVSTVTIKNVGSKGAALYKANGDLVGTRSLASNSPWFTDKMATINGVQMYRVSTDEWVPASLITK